MSTYTQILYHIVFSSKGRRPVLSDSRRDELFMYMTGAIKNSHCRPVWLNGVRDHVHILLSLRPTVALADLVKDIKVASSVWIKDDHIFPNFDGWQEGYGAFTYSLHDEPELVAYLKAQEEHHRKTTFLEEYRKLLFDHGIKFEEKYFP
ncbi:MAG: IS200/IS605 family transposase [Terriglobia bacterium]|jgi:REP element-mobilizing transposase RayT